MLAICGKWLYNTEKDLADPVEKQGGTINEPN